MIKLYIGICNCIPYRYAGCFKKSKDTRCNARVCSWCYDCCVLLVTIGMSLSLKDFSKFKQAPAIEAAENMEQYGKTWAWVPAAVGFGTGAFSMLGAERVLDFFTRMTRGASHPKKNDDSTILDDETSSPLNSAFGVEADATSVRRVLLLVLAITVHNFPEGMAVGVGFGSVGSSESATFANAFNLAIGIGLQNFPEGLAVSMPLRRAGMKPFKSFLWGQASGIVEPLGGMLGAWAVMAVTPLLPYALSFAAGAMIFVVVDDLVPEASASGNQRLATIGTIIGFIVMMVMDVALG